MDKVFKTYDEQIALLNSRGIEILTAAERSVHIITDYIVIEPKSH